MAQSLSFVPICSLKSSSRLRAVTGNSVTRKAFRINEACLGSKARNFHALKATDDNQSTKTKSIVCPDCDGNGAILCTQCQGTGVNSVDHFNGQFKAGGLCWLCSKNYAAQAFPFKMFAKGKGCVVILMGPLLPNAKAALEAWETKDTQIISWILGSSEPQMVKNCTPTAKEMRDYLKCI